jgi:hypothetical protein
MIFRALRALLDGVIAEISPFPPAELEKGGSRLAAEKSPSPFRMERGIRG